MKQKFSLVVLGLLLLSFAYTSCTEDHKSTLEHTIDQPKMREVSELVTLMFKMEGDLKLVRAGLVADSIFAQTEQFMYEDLFTAQASADVRRDSVYVVNGTAYLKYIHQLSQSKIKDSALVSFNNTIDACVTCHESYCPGPVARIKKLRIN